MYDHRSALDPPCWTQSKSKADAQCDEAIGHIQRGNRGAAAVAIQAALTHCPGHCEASRLYRLQTTSPPLNLTELEPQSCFDGISHERFRRQSGCDTDITKPTAMTLLRSLGVVSRFMATEDEYMRFAPNHPFVECEHALDQAWSCARESASSTETKIRQAWQLMVLAAPEGVIRGAPSICALGLVHPACASTGFQAATSMAAAYPDNALWAAVQTELAKRSGRKRVARQLARRMLPKSCSYPILLQ